MSLEHSENLLEPNIQIDLIEVWVRDLDKTERALTEVFGFDMQGGFCQAPSDEKAVRLCCGCLTILLRQAQTINGSQAVATKTFSVPPWIRCVVRKAAI